MSVAAINAAYHITAGGARNKAVLLALADCVNKDDVDRCWPHISTLATKTEMDERTVRAALADLVKRGLISRKPQYHPGTKYRKADLFTLHLKSDSGSAAHPGEAPAYPGDTPAYPGNAPGYIRARHPLHPGESPGQREPEVNQNVEPEKNQARARDAFDVEFDEQFWPLYPNRIDRKKAREAYVKARKRGIPFDDIMGGLKRYVAAHPVDYQYWKGPAAWLNSERWNDQPAQSPSRRIDDDNIVDAVCRAKARVQHRSDNIVDVDFAVAGGTR